MSKYLDYDGLGHLITKIKNEQDAGRPRIAGLVLPFAGAVAPIGYLMCDGAEYSTADYPELYEAIGRAYTATDAAETVFNVPNLIGRVPIGSGSYSDSTTGQSAIYELGATAGEVEHTLSVEEMPSHSHSLKVVHSEGTGNEYGREASVTTVMFEDGNIGNTGGDQAHNNMQPYVVTNYIISTGKIAVSESSVTDDDLQEQITTLFETTAVQKESITSLETQVSTQQKRWDAVDTMIWSGDWSSGSITVDNLSNYHLFSIKLKDAATRLLCFSPSGGSDFRAWGGYVNTTPNVFAYALTATRSGNTLTMVKCGSINVEGATVSDQAVETIWGII